MVSTATKTALLDAAEELFSECGYAAVRTRDLAERAGTNVSSIKYHFGSKRQLYLETLRRLLQHPDIRGSWDAFDPLPSTSREGAVLLVLFVHGAFAQSVAGGRPERCVRLMLQENLRPGEDFEFILEHFAAPYERLMVELLRVIAPDRSEPFYVTTGRGVFAQVLHYFVWKRFTERSEYERLGHGLPVDVAAREVALSILRGLGCSPELVENAMSLARTSLSDDLTG